MILNEERRFKICTIGRIPNRQRWRVSQATIRRVRETPIWRLAFPGKNGRARHPHEPAERYLLRLKEERTAG